MLSENIKRKEEEKFKINIEDYIYIKNNKFNNVFNIMQGE